jgi:hypothetical protein
VTQTSHAAYVSRDAILKLLSDDEVARVSTAEGSSGLHDGAEYLDLEHIDQGVQKANASMKLTMGYVIPKAAVSTDTWSKIVAHIGR